MKFNLKNRPKMRNYPIKFYDTREVCEWFEGFEKELREMIKRHNETFHYTAAEVFEEILGDDSKEYNSNNK